MPEYRHRTNHRTRRITLRLSPDGEVIVTTPPRFSKRQVEAFLTSQAGWIAEHRQLLKARRPDSGQVQIFGKSYTVLVEHRVAGASRVVLDNNHLIIQLLSKTDATPAKVTELPPAARTTLDRFLKTTAERYLLPRVHQLGRTMHTDFGHVTLREQKSRWGSCSQAGNLNFNWRLVHHPPEVIDYVIIHELAHRTHMNHSTTFWQLVQRYDPMFKKHQGWLKRHGLALS